MEGTRVGGRFDLLVKAGEGGMGEVWKALDTHTGEHVALKRILRTGGDTVRFLRESRLLERVKHPALVAHVAHGNDDGHPFLAMAWVDGESLAARLSREPLSLAEAISLARRLADALGALHEQGIVHRDIKPANVMLPDGDVQRALLLDLGVARPTFATVALTGPDLMVGTIGYMAPEQARSGHAVTPSADVFALGCLLFECIAGEPLYRADNPIAVLAQLLVDSPRRLRSVRADVPEGLDALLASLLSVAPAERPRDGHAVGRLLAPWADVDGATAISVPRAPAARSQAEQRFALAAVMEFDPSSTDDATVGADAAGELMSRGVAAVKAAGGRFAQLSGTGGLVVSEARGTVADRVRAVAGVLRSVLDVVPTARAGLSAGLTATRAGVPAGEVLARAASLAREVSSGNIAVDETAGELLAEHFELDSGVLGASRDGSGARATPFVGREKELAMLEGTLAEALDERAPRGVLVLATPGTGKSRLGRELLKRLKRRDDVRVLEARADVTTAGSLNAMMRALLRTAASLPRQPSASDAQVLRAHLATLPTLENPARVGDFLCDLLGAPTDTPCIELAASRHDAELTKKWMKRSVRAWLAAECEASGLVLLLEDLHWGDELTLEYLGEALRTLDDSPLFVVALARPEVREVLRAPWTHTVELPLAELGSKASERLVRAALGKEAAAEQVASVVDRGAGNPLFLEELVRFVQEKRRGELPASIAAVLHARLDALAVEQRRVLRGASVLGDRFELGELAAVVDEAPREVERLLASLSGKSLVEPLDECWAFHHALVRETAYATLPEEELRLSHGRAADWLEARGAPEPGEMLRHVEKAGPPEREAHWLVTTTMVASENGADRQAATLAERGLRMPLSQAQRGRLHVVAGIGAFFFDLDPAQALQHCRQAMADIPPDDAYLDVARGAASYVGLVCGDVGLLMQAIEWTLAAAERLSGRWGGFSASAGISALTHMGQQDLARRLLETSAPLREQPAAAPFWLYAAALQAYFNGGRVAESRRLGQAAGRAGLVVGDELALGLSRLLEVAFAGLCRSPRLEAMCAALDGEASNTWVGRWLRLDLDFIRCFNGKGDLAQLERHQQATDIVMAEHARLACAIVRVVEEPAQAESILQEAPFMTPSNGTPALALRAWLATRRGEQEAAWALAEEATTATTQSSGFMAWEFIHLTRISVLAAQGRLDEARVSMLAAIDRLAITLEGADDFMIEVVDEGCLPVLELRKLAGELGVSFPSIAELARPRSAAGRPDQS
jgi:eukaryotic-like serine/threonine-protein kinase